MSVPIPYEDKPRRRDGVVCAGALVLDTLVHPFESLKWGTTSFVDCIESRVGGSAANTARALSILGVSVRLSAFLGQDEPAAAIRRELSRCGVNLSSIVTVAESTPQTIVLVNRTGDRQFLHRKGCSEVAYRNGLSFTSELVDGHAHFHLASLFVVPHLREQAPFMLQQARAAGLSTSLDTCWDPLGEWMQVLRPCLPHLDILFMNEDEAAQVGAGRATAELAHAILDSGPGMIVLKRGREGCEIYARAQEIICPAYDVEARDSTGAGDCFVAGFLAAHLEGATAERAGHMGNAAGALSVRQIGAIEGLLSRAEIEDWMACTPLRRAWD